MSNSYQNTYSNVRILNTGIVGPIDLVWNFLCTLIPNSSPNTISSRFGSNEFVDGATVLYTHFVLPQLLLSSAYNQHICALHDSIKLKEEQFKETIRLMSLMRMEPKHATPEALSCSSSVPSISDLEQVSSHISQCSTVKLPSLTQSQLSEIFTSQLSAYEDSVLEVPSPGQDAIRSNVDLDRTPSFTNNSEMSQAERERIQMEENLKAEADARERRIRQELKEMDKRNAEKATKKPQEEISHSPAITLVQFDLNMNEKEQAAYLKRMRVSLSMKDLPAVTKEFIELKNNNVTPNLEIYHILLKACSLTADLPSAIEIIKQMYKDSISPVKETYKHLLSVVEASSDHMRAINIVRSMANGQIPLSDKKQFLQGSTDPLEFEIDLDVWKMMLSAITTPHKLYSTRSMEYFEEVKNLGEIFLETHKRPFDKETWRLLVRTLGSYPKKSKSFDLVLKDLQDEHSITPELYSEIIWALSRKSKVEDAMIYLDQLISDFKYIPSREPLYALTSYYADLGEYQETGYLIENYAKLIKCEEQPPGRPGNWEIDFTTVLMQAYVQALRNRTTPQRGASYHGNPIPIVMREDIVDHFSRENFTKSTFYASWERLMKSVERSDSTFYRDHYDLIIRFNVFANKIDDTKFPLENCLQMIKSMRGNGMEPSFETYKFLLEGYSKSTSNDTSNHRVEKALEIFEMIRLAGYDVDNLQVFQPLLDSCLPNVKSRVDGQTAVGNRFGKKAKNGVESISLLHKSSTPKIFEIEKLMKGMKVMHNQKSIITILEYLGETGNYASMWKRWTEISLTGHRRSELLYETILRLASRDLTESEYAINVVRHQMKREPPPIRPTLGIYHQLFECCLKCNDTLTIRELIEEINDVQFGGMVGNHLMKSGDYSGDGRSGFFGTDSLIVSKEDQSKLQALVLNTCFKLPVLYKDGEKLARNNLECRKDLIDFDFWKLLLDYYTEHDDSNVQKTFEMFVDWRDHNRGFNKSDMFGGDDECVDTTTDHIATATRIQDLRFPIPPLTLEDIEIINIYGRNSIRKGEFNLAKEILTYIITNFQLSPPAPLKLTKPHISSCQISNFDRPTASSSSSKIDSRIIDMNILKEFAYLTFKQNKLDELRWLEKNIITKIGFFSTPSAASFPSTSYSASLPSDQKEFAQKKDFEILLKWITKCLSVSSLSSPPISPLRHNKKRTNGSSTERPTSYESYVNHTLQEESASANEVLKSLNHLAAKSNTAKDGEGGRGTKV
ncbi:4497_t:CDS:2 [Acaulospora colombiana]|uniref:4497_t:CDS:1 n=1 Tax=Acaulospora colombiana TaxID=27376 RepID=A0ACA9L8I5_9GLOM|nr:4497_t:CDS:2 [Acaulospora colombiana]